MDFPPILKGPEHAAFSRSILAGLTASPKTIEPRWLYDAVGAKLFEAITNLDHYYVSRTETALIETNAESIADALGEGVTIVEPGSGEAVKVRPILAALGDRAAAYIPIDIAAEQLEDVAGSLAALYPDLAVRSIVADFFQPFTMEKPDNAVVFFPGSTIGNMVPERAVELLSTLREATGAARFLIGFDLVKDRRTLLDAYDDPAGVTAAFAKNVLQRINRELLADFDLRAFDFDARFNEETKAIEMRLVARHAHTVEVAGRPIQFAAGETIHTEDSRKYTPESFQALAAKAGLSAVETWVDKEFPFALMLFDVD